MIVICIRCRNELLWPLNVLSQLLDIDCFESIIYFTRERNSESFWDRVTQWYILIAQLSPD